MTLDLKGKVAVITGSNRGLGRAVAIELAKQGATVVINYRNNKREAEETLKQIRAQSPKPNPQSPLLIKADVTKEKEVQKMFSEVLKKFGRIDILMNNVGNFCFCKFSELSNADFKDVIESNIYGTLFCSRAALEIMRKQKSGNIINVGCASCDRITIREKTTPYYLAKTGVYMLTKVMAMEEAKNGIRINMVSPGILETSITKEKVPMGRDATFQDIINAILFLLDEKSSYLNGANIEVAGGWVPGSK